jgi:hypothetical protein
LALGRPQALARRRSGTRIKKPVPFAEIRATLRARSPIKETETHAI